MNEYHKSKLWKKLDYYQNDESHKTIIEKIKKSLDSLYKNCEYFSGYIQKSFPSYTMHGGEHSIALWGIASDLLLDLDEDDFNPIEIYVLGASFFIHDLGMALELIPNSLEELKLTDLWKDAKTYIEKNEEIENENLEQKVLTFVLRKMHGKRANEIATFNYTHKDGHSMYLIEDSELRNSYGEAIGLISSSHMWDLSEVEAKLGNNISGFSEIPREWVANPIKLACVLRASDAINIDSSRAPEILNCVLNPTGISRKHWSFHTKLNNPILEYDRIMFNSGKSFKEDEADSWWAFYEMLEIIDKELREIDILLSSLNIPRLKAIGVKDIGDPLRISKNVKTTDWIPVKAEIKVSNVVKLATSLGGESLYGEDYLVPIREIIQNASDAIRARNILSNNDYAGKIVIECGYDDKGEFFSVLDNGVGMSSKVLTGSLLNFSESFWGTPSMHDEFPSLEYKKFKSTGKYGIGFFSLFMLGDEISIITKKYNKGNDETLILNFKEGISSRPILRKAKSGEFLTEGGTKIIIRPKRSIYELLKPKNIRKLPIEYSYRNLEELIEVLCPAMDCDIFLKKDSKEKRIIKANDWITLKPFNLAMRSIGRTKYNKLYDEEKVLIKKFLKNMESIYDENKECIARIFLYFEPEGVFRIPFSECSITVGGLKSCNMDGAIGIVKGETNVASRNMAYPVISNKSLQAWVSNQVEKLKKSGLTTAEELKLSSKVRSIGVSTSDLKIAEHKSGFLNIEELDTLLNKLNKNTYIIASESLFFDEKRKNLELNDNVFIVNKGILPILRCHSDLYNERWPKIDNIKNFHDASLCGLLIERIANSWDISLKELKKKSFFSTDNKVYKATVGNKNGEEISFNNIYIITKEKIEISKHIVNSEKIKRYARLFC